MQGRVSSLTNGTARTFRVVAYNSEGQGSPSQDSNSKAPYGDPTASVTSAQTGVDGSSAQWCWSTNANFAPTATVQVNDSGSWVNAAASGCRSPNIGQPASRTVQVRITTNGDRGALTASSSGTISTRQTRWVLTATETTCPEKDFTGTANYNSSNLSCGQDGAGGYVYPGQTITVTCYTDSGYEVEGSRRWVKWDGQQKYSFRNHFSGDITGMPAC